MIDENGRGVLIDWELAIRVRDKNGASLENEARQHDRAVSYSQTVLLSLLNLIVAR